MNFIEAMKVAEEGYKTWAEKPHNAKWVKRIDGTPIPNDLLVNIAEAFVGHRMKSAGRAEASAWRPISEVQPRDVVLVWDNGTLSRDPGVKVWRAGSQKITTPGITHFMPLPTPPEGGE